MSRMQIKIPRDIERRKASPDMDLYRCLVTLLPEGIEILTREALAERRGFFRIKDAVTTGVSHHYWEFEVIE